MERQALPPSVEYWQDDIKEFELGDLNKVKLQPKGMGRFEAGDIIEVELPIDDEGTMFDTFRGEVLGFNAENNKGRVVYFELEDGWASFDLISGDGRIPRFWCRHEL